MTVKEHYDLHLAGFYSWMTGDFEVNQQTFYQFLTDHSILPSSTKNALDLGAGHGLQSIPLARLGFRVTAIDFSSQLLDEMKRNAGGLNIHVLNADMKNILPFAHQGIELIVCCGDTLSHLESKEGIETLLRDISSVLVPGGKPSSLSAITL